ncbi:P2X purinoceptor 7 [Ixodes scapularis]|uniref:P2X purinoceptor 7 n=2 Tax=Ixodes scapularis TaxID=6945 RepID=UPI001A9FA569|nr:P2X purinoceptor 7 [Ixodes scapularis]
MAGLDGYRWVDEQVSDVSDISEEEDDAFSAIVADRRFGLQPYVYDPSASSSSEASEGDGDMPDTPPRARPSQRVGTANWCSCNSSCRPMETDQESVCCLELQDVRELCSNQGVPCITKHPLFELHCLNRDVLELEYIKLQFYCPIDAQDRGPQERYRYTAYRQFTWWVYHILGRGNRKVLPSCVVSRIRQEFPSFNGRYVGFRQ